MVTKTLKTILMAMVVITYTMNANAGGPKDKPKKQEEQKVTEHCCDTSCEKTFNTFPLPARSLMAEKEGVCKKALLEYLKAEREKERKENDKEHIQVPAANDIL